MWSAWPPPLLTGKWCGWMRLLMAKGRVGMSVLLERGVGWGGAPGAGTGLTGAQGGAHRPPGRGGRCGLLRW
ncbi:hypothetical protein GCM10010341_14830 [Streptomyces noursei]|nr:hypothetical protein GCM10010341_14830 [Streptomyces noursei]